MSIYLKCSYDQIKMEMKNLKIAFFHDTYKVETEFSRLLLNLCATGSLFTLLILRVLSVLILVKFYTQVSLFSCMTLQIY